MRNIYIYTAIIICSALYIVSAFGFVSFAQMSGSSYKIQSDSINFGGGLSTSTSYDQESTVGEVATGDSSSATYKIKAGYQQMQEVYIAISAVSDVVMSPNIGGITGGTSNGSTNVTVITDSPSGYELTIKASSSPALVSGSNSFADYTPASVGVPDYTFAIASTDSEFAFTPEGSHIVQKFKDNGSNTCNTGSSDTNGSGSCWMGLSTTATSTILTSGETTASGSTSSVYFIVSVGSNSGLAEDTYVATATLTAVTN